MVHFTMLNKVEILTEKNAWIKEREEALFTKIKFQGYDSMNESHYFDTTQLLKLKI